MDGAIFYRMLRAEVVVGEVSQSRPAPYHSPLDQPHDPRDALGVDARDEQGQIPGRLDRTGLHPMLNDAEMCSG